MPIVNVNDSLALVTHGKGKAPRVVVGVRLTPGTLAKLDAYADGAGVTRSKAAARLLFAALRGV